VRKFRSGVDNQGKVSGAFRYKRKERRRLSRGIGGAGKTAQSQADHLARLCEVPVPRKVSVSSELRVAEWRVQDFSARALSNSELSTLKTDASPTPTESKNSRAGEDLEWEISPGFTAIHRRKLAPGKSIIIGRAPVVARRACRTSL